MLKKGFEEVWSTMLRYKRVGDFLGQIVDIMREEVGHLAIFGMPPGMIHDIEFGSVSREELHVHPVPIDIPQQTGGFSVSAEAVPDKQQRPLEMAAQLLDKGKGIVTGNVPGGHREIEAQTFFAQATR
jgi:hypothetical protein